MYYNGTDDNKNGGHKGDSAASYDVRSAQQTTAASVSGSLRHYLHDRMAYLRCTSACCLMRCVSGAIAKRTVDSLLTKLIS